MLSPAMVQTPLVTNSSEPARGDAWPSSRSSTTRVAGASRPSSKLMIVSVPSFSIRTNGPSISSTCRITVCSSASDATGGARLLALSVEFTPPSLQTLFHQVRICQRAVHLLQFVISTDLLDVIGYVSPHASQRRHRRRHTQGSRHSLQFCHILEFFHSITNLFSARLNFRRQG